ncbi:hypothetical protein FNV43_RR23410 [Rhamnella rubrinervis]|uniref:Uncharacterized protein n=1 Tax=Rhamnella rubrinervis TaxID=2594499 RepID=A0A8K0GTC5_9ROSA|nr:hypothetical protein FNV43_RR23410 [Rhamnella rubrinervis]
MLEEDMDDQWLQTVAMEFNIPITCYLTPFNSDPPHHFINKFRLRWFSPIVEVKLCGHATLAAAHTLFTSGLVDSDIIEFVTLSGILTAKRSSSVPKNGKGQESYYIELNLPNIPIAQFNSSEATMISNALGVDHATVIDIKTTAANDLLVVLPSARHVVDAQPKFETIQNCATRGIIITGIAPPESEFDFYSRFFYPKLGFNEDSVCGSGHCALARHWCNQLGKCDFVAYSASMRGGVVKVHVDEQEQRVLLQGKACTVMEGTLLL